MTWSLCRFAVLNQMIGFIDRGARSILISASLFLAIPSVGHNA